MVVIQRIRLQRIDHPEVIYLFFFAYTGCLKVFMLKTYISRTRGDEVF